MIKSELVQRLTEKLAEQGQELYQRDVEIVVNAVLDTITQALTDGHRVEIRGFGSFSTRERRARKGRNPRTGSEVAVPIKRMPHFKPGKDMLEDINGGKVPGRNRKR